MKDVRVRYAPSPTGYLHIGNARTALFNYLFAKKNNGKFIIRIEDTDLKRNIEDGVASQLENLKWLGLEWDESIDIDGGFGPYSQLKRCEEKIYDKYVQQLLNNGCAYRCFCSSSELEKEAEIQKSAGKIPRYSQKCRNLSKEEIDLKLKNNESYSVRFKVQSNEEIIFEDMVKKRVIFNSDDVSGDFNILKQNGIPTYNFAVVVDDYLMQISHVLRGEDHISNTPKQIMLYNALGFEVPIFCHMTLIVNEEGKKLSKRDTSIVQFIQEYKNLGYLPKAMFNFISLLGWSPEGTQEIFTKEELCGLFDSNRLSKSSAKFDVNKLKWINNQYIKEMSDEEYLELVLKFIDQNTYPQEVLKKIVLLYKDQISCGSEIDEVAKLFFEKQSLSEDCVKFLKENDVTDTIKEFSSLLNELDILSVESVKECIKLAAKNTNAKGKMLFMPIRIATTMQMHGPELADTLVLLSKEKVLNNINIVLKNS